MWEWVKEHVEWSATVVAAALSAALAFVWGVRKTRADLDQLRVEFGDHMGKAEPMMQDFVAFKGEIRGEVHTLHETMEARFEALNVGVDALRTDFRTMNLLLVRVLKRGLGGIREEDEP